jgi:hypothetical protein
VLAVLAALPKPPVFVQPYHTLVAVQVYGCGGVMHWPVMVQFWFVGHAPLLVPHLTLPPQPSSSCGGEAMKGQTQEDRERQKDRVRAQKKQRYKHTLFFPAGAALTSPHCLPAAQAFLGEHADVGTADTHWVPSALQVELFGQLPPSSGGPHGIWPWQPSS